MRLALMNVRLPSFRRPRAARLLCIASAIVACAGVWLDGQAAQGRQQPPPSSQQAPSSQAQQAPAQPPPVPPAPPSGPPLMLLADASHDREMQPGEVHHYAIDLREGEFFQAVAEMRGLDVRVAVTTPDDREILSLVSIGMRYGPEPIAFIAPTTGRIRLDVHAGRLVKKPGRYQLQVVALREPDANDRAFAAAARASADASIAARQRTEENGRLATRDLTEALAFWEARGDRRQQAQAHVALGLLARHYVYDNPRAAVHLRQAVDLWRALDDEWGEAVAVSHLSEALQTLGEIEAALAARERARDLHRAAGRRADEAAALDSLALAWIRLGEFHRTIELANEARAIFREVGDRTGEAYALSDVALVYVRTGQWDLAIDHYRQAQRLAPDETSFEAIALTQIGLAQFNLGDLDAARATSERALAICQKNRYRLHEGNVLSNLTMIYAEQGDVAKAIEVGEAAQAIYRGASDVTGQAILASRLGTLYARRGDPQAARAVYEAGLGLIRGGDPRNEAAIHQGLGELERDAGRLAEAVRHAQVGVTLVESLRARVQNQRTRQSMFAVAQPLYELLVDILMREHAADPSRGHAAAALEIAERARARSLLELLGEERVDVQRSADPALIAEARTVRARLNVAADALTQAQRARAAAIERSRAATAGGETKKQATDRPAGQRAGQTGTQTAHLSADRGSAEEEAAERVAEIERQIAADMEALERIEDGLRRASPKYAALTEPSPLSTAALQREVLDADTLLLEIMLGKSSSYLWVLSPTTLTSYRLPPRDEIEQAARLVYEALSTPPGSRGTVSGGGGATSAVGNVGGAGVGGAGAGVGGGGSTGSADTAPVTQEEYERRARALSDLVLGPAASVLKARRLVIVAPSLLEYVPFAALPIPSGVASTARSGESGASSSSASSSSASSSSASSSSASSSSTFEPLIARFEVVTAPSASVVATLRRERAERGKPSKAIAILADPVFDTSDPRVARARARTATTSATRGAAPDNAGRVVIESGSSPASSASSASPAASSPSESSAPSASSAPSSASSASSSSSASPSASSPPSSPPTQLETALPSALDRAWRGVRGNAAGGPAFTRLPFSRLEADAIAAAAPRGAAFKAVDFDATHDFATSPALADYRIVHFATHGVLHARQPDLSGVVLSLVDAKGRTVDGFLRLHEIYNLQLKADLVVLSGCQTALGKAVRGEGLVGLTRGFMYAGAPRVVASLWQVDDLATSELMARFYRNLFGGQQQPAAALRAAQLDLARSTRWRNPYFWAAFTLQGDWQPPTTP